MPICSLFAIAFHANLVARVDKVYVLLDARMKEVYYREFDFANNTLSPSTFMVFANPEVRVGSADSVNISEDAFVCGSGAKVYLQHNNDFLGVDISSLLNLGQRFGNNALTALEAQAIYIRHPVKS